MALLALALARGLKNKNKKPKTRKKQKNNREPVDLRPPASLSFFCGLSAMYASGVGFGHAAVALEFPFIYELVLSGGPFIWCLRETFFFRRPFLFIPPTAIFLIPSEKVI
jgi:hypothetical protein